MKNRHGVCLTAALLIVCLVALAGGSFAADKYPSRPVTTIITFAPGGVADLTMRIWNKYLQKYAGGTFVTDYKPGGGGVVGYTAVANARPDGYILGNFPDYFLPVLLGTATYKMDDFQVIAQVDKNGSTLVVANDAPWKTYQEFVDYCHAHPGVKWGHQGTSTMIYFRMENLNREAKLKLTPVPLKGDSEIIAGLLGKHIQVGTIGAASAKAQAEGGKLRILFSFDPPKAFGLDPSLPSMASFYKNAFVDVDVPVYLVAPKKTPPEVIAVLQNALEKASKDPEFIKEEAGISHFVEFVPGKVAQEQRIPKKMAIVKEIMKDIGMLK